MKSKITKKKVVVPVKLTPEKAAYFKAYKTTD
jgi:hypothetical protein